MGKSLTTPGLYQKDMRRGSREHKRYWSTGDAKIPVFLAFPPLAWYNRRYGVENPPKQNNIASFYHSCFHALPGPAGLGVEKILWRRVFPVGGRVQWTCRVSVQGVRPFHCREFLRTSLSWYREKFSWANMAFPVLRWCRLLSFVTVTLTQRFDNEQILRFHRQFFR